MEQLKLARVVDVTVTDDTLTVDLEDGRTIAVPIGWYPRLAHGTPEERANFQISGNNTRSSGLIYRSSTSPLAFAHDRLAGVGRPAAS